MDMNRPAMEKDIEFRSVKTAVLNVFRTEYVSSAESVCHCIGQGAQEIIIAVYNRVTVRLHVLKHFRFPVEDVLSGTKKLDVRNADVGNNADVRTDNTGERPYLSRMVGSELKNGNFVLLPDLEHSLGYPRLVVQISGGSVGAEMSGKDGIQHLLCGGFPCASRYADNRYAVCD